MREELCRCGARGLFPGMGLGVLIAWISCGISFGQGEPKGAATGVTTAVTVKPTTGLDPALEKEWLKRWEQNVLHDIGRSRPCDTLMGESIGWGVSPYLNAFYFGYMATGDRAWVDRLTDWTDAVLKRGVKEPDGYIGWPKAEDDGVLEYLPPGMQTRYTDTMVSDAMLLRPVAMMAGEILKTPALKEKYGAKAEEYLQFCERTFEKWNSRGAWRDTNLVGGSDPKAGGIWVVPPFGIDQKTGQWTDGYDQRFTDGNSLPANKENQIAKWLLAMYDVTQKTIYRDRAEKWFRVMKSRLRLREDGKYYVWNYWDVGVPWDKNPDGSIKHWVGVHPNGGYYADDLEGIVPAYEHGLVFTREDMARFIATNRDFMWNKEIKNAKFQRIDGRRSATDVPPGQLWYALTPYDPMLQKIFEANFDPGSWDGVWTAEWIMHFRRVAAAGK